MFLSGGSITLLSKVPILAPSANSSSLLKVLNRAVCFITVRNHEPGSRLGILGLGPFENVWTCFMESFADSKTQGPSKP